MKTDRHREKTRWRHREKRRREASEDTNPTDILSCTFSLQNLQKTTEWCVNHLIYGALLWRPGQVNAVIIREAKVGSYPLHCTVAVFHRHPASTQLDISLALSNAEFSIKHSSNDFMTNRKSLLQSLLSGRFVKWDLSLLSFFAYFLANVLL